MEMKSFEHQYAIRHQVAVGNSFVEVVNIIPEVYTSEIPVLYAPGWSESIEVSEVPLRAIHKMGRRVISLTHARNGIPYDKTTHLPAAVDRKSKSLLAIADYFNLDIFDLIGHSEGGMNGVEAAFAHPEQVRNLILISSSGLLPKDNLVRLAMRFTKEGIGMAMGSGKDQPEPGDILGTVTNIGGYILRNPWWSLQETLAISGRRIVEQVKQLQDQGIGIAIISNVDDRVFPILDLDREAIRGLLGEDRLGGFYSVKGNHNEILGDRRIASLAVSAIDNLEYKRARAH